MLKELSVNIYSCNASWQYAGGGLRCEISISFASARASVKKWGTPFLELTVTGPNSDSRVVE